MKTKAGRVNVAKIVKILSVFLLFFSCTLWVFPKEDPWGNLKKIHVFHKINSDDAALKALTLIDFEGLKRVDQREIAKDLITFGDAYMYQGKYAHAEAFYLKVLNLSPEYWFLYNKLEKINREKGGFFVSFKSIFKQFTMAMQNFKSSFIMVNQFLNQLFFGVLFVFFLFTGFMIIKYFKLLYNDLLHDHNVKIPTQKLLFFIGIIFWPVILLGGWMIYPFIIGGIIYTYINENEKKAMMSIMICIGIVTLIYSVNRVWENTYGSDAFKKVVNVYDGTLYGKDDYLGFDDDLKVIQAFSYYENGDNNKALDILNSTSEKYRSASKMILKGNIYYRFGEFEQSRDFYTEALKIDDHDPVALNNFTLILVKEGKQDQLKAFANRYSAINTLRLQPLHIKDIKINQGELWNRLFNNSKNSFSLGGFIGSLTGQIFKLPVLYYFIIFFLYYFGLKRIRSTLGESAFCAKCGKIVKEGLIHKSHLLCDDCHQLFSIKDVIFLEAKILKEKELKARYKKRYFWGLTFSLLIPGVNFNHRDDNRFLTVAGIIFYVLIGFSIWGTVNFTRIYSAAPLFLNLVGAGAVVVYFLINLFSVVGDEDGF